MENSDLDYGATEEAADNETISSTTLPALDGTSYLRLISFLVNYSPTGRSAPAIQRLVDKSGPTTPTYECAWMFAEVTPANARDAALHLNRHRPLAVTVFFQYNDTNAAHAILLSPSASLFFDPLMRPYESYLTKSAPLKLFLDSLDHSYFDFDAICSSQRSYQDRFIASTSCAWWCTAMLELVLNPKYERSLKGPEWIELLDSSDILHLSASKHTQNENEAALYVHFARDLQVPVNAIRKHGSIPISESVRERAIVPPDSQDDLDKHR